MRRPHVEFVRFSSVERKLLSDLAAVQEVSVESLIREALNLPPYKPERRPRHLRIVRRRDDARTTGRLAL
jgi:hypothetical protein